MALKTQGFALSALPTSPKVPDNIGVLDMKAISDGVRRGLDTFEAVRRAPQSMILADAQMAAETAKQPLATRQALAQTEGIEQQTPLKTAILAEQASPEYMAAQRQALLNKSVRQPSGDVQLASALATAKMRLAEDPTDAAAALLVATLEPMAMKRSASSMANPQGAIDAGVAKTADTNATRTNIATDRNATQTSIADQNRSSVEQRASEERALREKLAAEGRTQSQINTEITARGRTDAARAAFTGKTYETAAQKNEKVNQELAALKVLDQKVDAYKKSFLGAGVVVGSAPMVAVRSIFGDNTGKELAAAVALSMTSAVETMRGLGAMSEKEFSAAMSQLPQPNDPVEALDTKMDYLNVVRPWIAARNTMFLERLEAGDSPMVAHAKVRRALPLIGPDGNIVDPVTATTPAAPSVNAPAAATPTSFGTPEEADAAGAAGTIQPGQRIMVGGRPATWNP